MGAVSTLRIPGSQDIQGNRGSRGSRDIRDTVANGSDTTDCREQCFLSIVQTYPPHHHLPMASIQSNFRTCRKHISLA